MSSIQWPDKKLVDTVKAIVINQAEEKLGYVSPDSVHNGTSLKYDLALDSLDNLEIIMEFEKQFNVKIQDTTELEKNLNFGEFCYILSSKTHEKQTPRKQLTTDEIFNIIYKHLYKKYEIPYTKLTSNWYKDLGLNSFQLADFYKWVEKKFNIKMPYFYFTDINKLCAVIYIEMEKPYTKTSLVNRIRQKMFYHSK